MKVFYEGMEMTKTKSNVSGALTLTALENWGGSHAWLPLENIPQVPEGALLGRVVSEAREIYSLEVFEAGGQSGREQLAELTGRLRYLSEDRESLPVVGDWVAVTAPSGFDRLLVHAILPRRTVLRRRAVASRGAQLLAANVDRAFLAMSLNQDFNPRRLERYLGICREAGVDPVIVATKLDLCAGDETLETRLEELRQAGRGAEVIGLSVWTRAGIQRFVDLASEPGKTSVLLGSSGVGKTTLVNFLLGEERLETQGIREGDDRGKHTTTRRELLLLPNGGVLIDTPGMRELGWLEGSDAGEQVFDEFGEWAARCRFTDCGHASEPGCAIRVAIESGELDAGRFAHWKKLEREAAFVERKSDPVVAARERERWKKIGKEGRERSLAKRGKT